MPTAAAVVLAGGSGTRLGAEGNKVYLPLAGRPLLSWSLAAFAGRRGSAGWCSSPARPTAAGPQQAARAVDRPVEIVDGGATRHDSEWAALRLLAPAIEAGELDVVAIHDGARPVVTQRLIEDALAAAREHGAAVPGVPLTDVADHDLTPVAGTLVRVQTPQAFRADLLLARVRAGRTADCFTGTDTAACVERYAGIPVHCIPGDPRNVKVTYRPDLVLAERPAQVLAASTAAASSRSSRSRTGERVRRTGNRHRPGTRRDRPVRPQRRRAHRPRILQLHQLVARHRTDDPPVRVDLLDRLGHLRPPARPRPPRPGPRRPPRSPGTPVPAAGAGRAARRPRHRPLRTQGDSDSKDSGESTETTSTTPLPRNAETAWSINVVPSSRARLDLVAGDEDDAGDGHGPLRRREPRRAAPRPCPRWSPRRARAR